MLKEEIAEKDKLIENKSLTIQSNDKMVVKYEQTVKEQKVSTVPKDKEHLPLRKIKVIEANFMAILIDRQQ